MLLCLFSTAQWSGVMRSLVGQEETCGLDKLWQGRRQTLFHTHHIARVDAAFQRQQQADYPLVAVITGQVQRGPVHLRLGLDIDTALQQNLAYFHLIVHGRKVQGRHAQPVGSERRSVRQRTPNAIHIVVPRVLEKLFAQVHARGGSLQVVLLLLDLAFGALKANTWLVRSGIELRSPTYYFVVQQVGVLHRIHISVRAESGHNFAGAAETVHRSMRTLSAAGRIPSKHNCSRFFC